MRVSIYRMNWWGAMIKKKEIAGLMCVIIILFVSGCHNYLEKIIREVGMVNPYLKINYGYEIRTIPIEVSVPPCLAGIQQLEFPQYVLVNELQEDSYEGAYYYPFNSSKEVEMIISEIEEDYKLDFYVLSNSIVYAPGEDGELSKVLKGAKIYFDTNDSQE